MGTATAGRVADLYGRREESRKGRATFPEFLQAVKRRDLEALKAFGSGYVSERGGTISKSIMGENSGVVGGYIVPTEMSDKLLATIAENSFIYPRANVLPMNSGETLCPVIDAITAQAAGVTPLFGGVSFNWGSEQAPNESEPTFRQVSLRAWDLVGYCTVSNQFLNDISPAAEDYLVKLLGGAAAWQAEYAFLQGLGADNRMPLGVINAPAKISTTRATVNQVSPNDLSSMAGSMLPGSWNRAIWACSPTAFNELSSSQSFSSNQGNLGPNAGTLFTRPLFVTDKLPPLGTAGDVVFFDPFLYVIGDRQQVIVDVSEQTLFRTNQTVFRVWLRLDGKPQLSGQVTLADGSTVASGYVVLT